jgi:hypothetical protein
MLIGPLTRTAARNQETGVEIGTLALGWRLRDVAASAVCNAAFAGSENRKMRTTIPKLI